MTLKDSTWGSNCEISDKTLKDICKSGLRGRRRAGDENTMFKDDQLFSELVYDVLTSNDHHCMNKLQDLEKMCNQYEHITIIVKQATEYYEVNVYSLTISPMNKVITDEQYFVLAHFVVLSCNWSRKRSRPSG